MKGFDCAADTSAIAHLLPAQGVHFVTRYYNVKNPAKNLTHQEAFNLSLHGVFCVAVYEDGFPTSAGYFSFEKGIADAKNAIAQADIVHQPFGSCIYYAVDFDSTEQEITDSIFPYFRGIRHAYEQLGITTGSTGYLLGVYGNGLACKALLGVGLVSHTWLAQPHGWGGSDFSQWNIKQGKGDTLLGLSIDWDTSAPKGGGGFLVK